MRALLAAVLATLLTGSLAAAAAPGAATPAAVPAPVPAPGVALAAPVTADIDDFFFSSFDADYTLSRDADGRSTLRTVERLVAEFPDFDQNRGILRAIPERYGGAPTDVTLVSVTDGEGQEREYETESEDGFLQVTIAGDDYVRGTQVYELIYDQRNVTLFPDGGGAEEFYWDVNGTGWAQPFGRVTATLHLDAALADRLTGNAACYVGGSGATDRCALEAAEEGDGAVLSATVENLGPYENATIAVGFAPGTFTPRDSSLLASPFAIPLLLALALLLAVVAATILHRVVRLRDAPGRPVIVAEYLPLAQPDLLLSAVLMRKQSRAVAATLVSLAVRGMLRIVELEGGGKKAAFALELLSREGRPRLGSGPRGASPAENGLLSAVFGRKADQARVVLDPKNAALAKRIHSATRRMSKDAIAQGYQTKPPTAPWVILAIAGTLAMTVTALFAILMLDDARGGWLPGLALLAVPFGVLAYILPAKHPLTAKGAEVRDHLRGIRDYLRLAEADRFRMLQSPEGAARAEVAGVPVVKLYERLLPHAVLFGVEKDWAGVIGTHYEQAQERPEWYAGPGTFNAAAFSSGIAGVSATTASSFSGSSSSSSSGGSSGGGSSGGGGGGGGGGGV